MSYYSLVCSNCYWLNRTIRHFDGFRTSSGVSHYFGSTKQDARLQGFCLPLIGIFTDFSKVTHTVSEIYRTWGLHELDFVEIVFVLQQIAPRLIDRLCRHWCFAKNDWESILLSLWHLSCLLSTVLSSMIAQRHTSLSSEHRDWSVLKNAYIVFFVATANQLLPKIILQNWVPKIGWISIEFPVE